MDGASPWTAAAVTPLWLPTHGNGKPWPKPKRRRGRRTPRWPAAPPAPPPGNRKVGHPTRAGREYYVFDENIVVEVRRRSGGGVTGGAGGGCARNDECRNPNDESMTKLKCPRPECRAGPGHWALVIDSTFVIRNSTLANDFTTNRSGPEPDRMPVFADPGKCSWQEANHPIYFRVP